MVWADVAGEGPVLTLSPIRRFTLMLFVYLCFIFLFDLSLDNSINAKMCQYIMQI